MITTPSLNHWRGLPAAGRVGVRKLLFSLKIRYHSADFNFTRTVAYVHDPAAKTEFLGSVCSTIRSGSSRTSDQISSCSGNVFEI